MPIYDFDGVLNREISKIFDNDGSTNHQIAQIFDNNGSVNSLIYSAEQYLFNYGLVDGYTWTTNRNASLSTVGGETCFSIWETSPDYASYITTSEAIDVTSWSTLKAYALFRNSSYTGGTSSLGLRSSSGWVDRVTITHTTVNADTYQMYELDVSNISGAYPIRMQAYCSAAGRPSGFYVFQIWLE